MLEVSSLEKKTCKGTSLVYGTLVCVHAYMHACICVSTCVRMCEHNAFYTRMQCIWTETTCMSRVTCIRMCACRVCMRAPTSSLHEGIVVDFRHAHVNTAGFQVAQRKNMLFMRICGHRLEEREKRTRLHLRALQLNN
jgi:hypothetical protein